jgi:3,4-dihydroxy 2-butanone 4-phosphate synthase/GTP cyclohydrolase II
MFRALNEEGKGAIVFINQASESFNLLKRLQGLRENQANGIIKAPGIDMDVKDFGIGAQILHDLNISKMRLMTNTSQTKRVGIVGYGLEIVEYVPY